MPTPEPTLLDERAVSEIEARALEIKELVGVGQFGEDMLRLCATVKHLRARVESLEAQLAQAEDEAVSAQDDLIDLRSRAVQLYKDKAAEWEARTVNSDDPTFKYHYQTRADAAKEMAAELEKL